MDDFRRTRLFQSTLAEEEDDPSAEVRRRLSSALAGLRTRAGRLAATISRDLPGLTGHDVEHIDALWSTADVIVGDEWQLSPAEAFVFGGAAILHDLGLSTAAYLDGAVDIERGIDYADALHVALRDHFDREPSRAELGGPPLPVRNAAREAVMRARHAERAADLATAALKGPDGAVYLIEDSELRDDLGWLIGQIAASHSWDLARVAAFFAPSAPTPKDLQGWNVDALTIACLLRCADATQLDGRRARALQQAVQDPEGGSVDHWNFQRLMHPVRVEGDRLVFESSRPFKASMTDAWWLAYDWLSMANREIQAVDALLAELRPERRFQARLVAGVDAPVRLAERVRTDGWLPVDARVHVSDVTRLARRLGGRQLYGDTAQVPLRELIQNATDAVRARWALEGGERSGSVTVAFKKTDGGGSVLEVSDDGIGMSRDVLTGPLLDFGSSLWTSPGVTHHLPGLASSGFRSTGRFGIGFFAAFMWSDRVVVRSRARLAGAADTNVLDFSGLARRPVLRPASTSEQLNVPGTTVRLSLESGRLAEIDSDRESQGDSGLAPPEQTKALVPWLAPASDVDIYVQGKGKRTRVLRRGDWTTIAPHRLLGRIMGRSDADVSMPDRELVTHLMMPLEQAGEIVGRAALMPERRAWRYRYRPPGALVVGGLRVAPYASLAGVLVGEDPNLARTEARPVATRATLSSWVEQQAILMADLSLGLDEALSCATTVAACGAPTATLPLCTCSDGPLDADGLSRWAAARHGRPIYVFVLDEVMDVSPIALEDFEPVGDVLAIRTFDDRSEWWDAAEGDATENSLRTLCYRIVEEAWAGVVMTSEPFDESPMHMGSGAVGEVKSEFYEVLLELSAEEWEELE